LRRLLSLFFSLGMIYPFLISCAVCQSAPSHYITAYGDEFSSGGTGFEFVGVNIRGLCHYGKKDILFWPETRHIDENLDGVASMGGKVVRFFGPCKFASNQENIDRIKIALDKMEARGLLGIVCLTDFYNTGFCPQGDESYYTEPYSYLILLGDAWFKTGYKVNYKPFVEMCVSQLKNHNAVFAWELGNELTDTGDPDTIMDFASDMASTIKSIDSRHMVTTGFIGVDHLQIGEAKGCQLYLDPNIDFITEHAYNNYYQAQNHAVHSRLGKPLILEEFGWNTTFGHRPTNILAKVNHYFDVREARGFMQWGYQAQSSDIGDGDNNLGMDSYAHPDYSELFAIYSSRASQLADNPAPLPLRLEPEGENIALLSVGWDADSIFSSAYGGDRVYDGAISEQSKWTSQGAAPPHWICIDLGRPALVNGITIRMAGAANEYISFNFTEFLVQTGSSLSGPWSTDFTVANPAQFSFIHALYENPKELRCIRIYITNCGVDNYARLPEIEVYEIKTLCRNWNLYK